ncbi:MAG: hypothetical protein ACK4NF_05830, partial [Planctomycetota bacterium]
NIPLLKVLTALSPEYEEVWAHHGWNLGLNVSRTEEDVEKSWQWIKEGLKTLREGLKFNPNSESLLTWYALLIYNRTLHYPIYEEKFFHYFNESPYKVAAWIYLKLSEEKRKMNPEGIYYEGFVNSLYFMDIFFQIRMKNFIEAKKALRTARLYSLYLVNLFRKYNTKVYRKRVHLAEELYPLVKLESIAMQKNNDFMRARLIKKYLKISRKFSRYATFEWFKNRITVLLATILNNSVFKEKINHSHSLKILTGLKNIFDEYSSGGEVWVAKIWEIHKVFIEEIMEIVKYEKEDKIHQIKEKVQEIKKKYPIYKFLNLSKYEKEQAND